MGQVVEPASQTDDTLTQTTHGKHNRQQAAAKVQNKAIASA